MPEPVEPVPEFKFFVQNMDNVAITLMPELIPIEPVPEFGSAFAAAAAPEDSSGFETVQAFISEHAATQDGVGILFCRENDDEYRQPTSRYKYENPTTAISAPAIPAMVSLELVSPAMPAPVIPAKGLTQQIGHGFLTDMHVLPLSSLTSVTQRLDTQWAFAFHVDMKTARVGIAIKSWLHRGISRLGIG